MDCWLSPPHSFSLFFFFNIYIYIRDDGGGGGGDLAAQVDLTLAVLWRLRPLLG